jgi:hypothetical protein
MNRDENAGGNAGLDAAGLTRRGFVVLAAAGVVAVAAGCQPYVPPQRRFTFSVAGKGNIRYDLNAFADHAMGTYAFPAGWSLGGAIQFSHVASGGDFTLWLCEAGLVPSFSSVCSSIYSCRVGRNVVINQDRWLGATSTWPYGLDQYRHYVVNHETGHWLGMQHWPSPGRGRVCPVMFQQSKGITDGSTYNTWPLEAEKQWVAAHWGVRERALARRSAVDTAPGGSRAPSAGPVAE